MADAPQASALRSCPSRAEYRAGAGAEARARSQSAVRELEAAIDVGERSYRRLSHGLDDFTTQLQSVRFRLRHAGNLIG